MSESKTPKSQETKPARVIDEQTQKHIDRFLQGKEVWNKWAEHMLAKKEGLEKAGKWQVKNSFDALRRRRKMSTDLSTPEIQSWLDEAYIDFSVLTFQTEQSSKLLGGEGVTTEDSKSSVKSIPILGDSIDFSKFLFPGEANFIETKFKGHTEFGKAKFTEMAFFSRAEFFGMINFSETEFAKEVVFWKTRFVRESYFREAKFIGYANFWNVEFIVNTNFIEAKFTRSADYREAKFKGYADFRGVEFKGAADYREAEFKGSVDYREAQFIGAADYRKAEFAGVADYRKAEFKGTVDYREAQFIGAADFMKATFAKVINFGKSSFAKAANFREATFKETSNFSQSIFFKSADFRLSDFERHADFSKTQFHKQADFEAILVKRAFSLADAEFISNIPNYTQANFAESPRLDNIKVLPVPKLQRSPLSWQRYFWTENYFPYVKRLLNRYLLNYPRHFWKKFTNTHRNPNEEAHYRALKRLAIQAHDHENEMKFFAGEIRARRHITDFPNFLTHDFASSMRYWAGVAYELFSDFGRSFIRPALWWFACLGLFANLTLSDPAVKNRLSNLENKEQCPNSILSANQAAYTIGLKNSLLILGLTKTNIVKQAELCLYGLNKNGTNKNGEANSKPKTYNPKIKRTYQTKSTKTDTTKTDIPFKAVVQGITHSLLSLLFIFLLLLAIRNQFKIK